MTASEHTNDNADPTLHDISMATPEEDAATAKAKADEEAAAAAAQPTVADLQAQLADAQGATAAAAEAGVTATREALRTANPDLPEAAFTGDTIEAINGTLKAHQETADGARTKEQADAKARAAGAVHAGPGSHREAPAVPANARGISKIAHALKNPGPGMTE